MQSLLDLLSSNADTIIARKPKNKEKKSSIMQINIYERERERERESVVTKEGEEGKVELLLKQSFHVCHFRGWPDLHFLKESNRQ